MNTDPKRIISPALFGLIVLCFFMPFLLVQCQGQTLATVSGVDMVTGTSISAGDYGSAQAVKPVSWAIFALLAALAGVAHGVISLTPTASPSMQRRFISLVAAALGSLCLLIIGIGGPSKVSGDSGGVVTASWGSGLTLGLLLFLVALGYNIYLAMNAESGPALQHFSPKMPAMPNLRGPSPGASQFCTQCGNQLPAGAKFCTACGASFAAGPPMAGAPAAPAAPMPVAAPPQYAPPVATPAAPATMFAPAALTWTLLLADGTRYGLKLGQVRVGRASDNDIVLTDPSVSRAHAVLQVAEGSITLTDLNSTSGTNVNGQRVATAEVRDGDTVHFGQAEALIENAGA